MKRTLKLTLYTALAAVLLLSGCDAAPAPAPPPTPTVAVSASGAQDDAQSAARPDLHDTGTPAATQSHPTAGTSTARRTPVPTLPPVSSPTPPPFTTPATQGGAPRPTPTPDPLRDIPERDVTSTYVVQRGDTLSGIAEAIGISINELMRMNGITNADRVKEGQELIIKLPIEGHAPSVKLIPDSELVNSPTAAQFDLAGFVASRPGYLNRYSELVDGEDMPGWRIVARVAEQHSVHPRLLLALLEYKGGWVDNPEPSEEQLRWPLGYKLIDRQSLYFQLVWASARLNEGYYGWRLGSRLWVRLEDNSQAYMGNGINAGTAGLQNYLSAISTRPVWLDVLGTGERSFIQTYRRLFGDPWAYDFGTLVPDDLKQPTFTLPWRKGETWLYTGGPHSAWGNGTPWGALDFTAWNAYGCNELDDWVTAVTNGVIARSTHGEVMQALDPSGDERIGWSILYLHMATPERVQAGQRVSVGSRIGHPSCEGGISNGAHVHIVRKYNGEWLNAVGPIPFNLGGWTPLDDTGEYDGDLTNGKGTRTPCECKEQDINAMTW